MLYYYDEDDDYGKRVGNEDDDVSEFFSYYNTIFSNMKHADEDEMMMLGI